MIINSTRGIKAAPDRQKIDNMLPYLNTEKLTDIYNELSVKRKKKCDEYIFKHCPALNICDGNIVYIGREVAKDTHKAEAKKHIKSEKGGKISAEALRRSFPGEGKKNNKNPSLKLQ